MCNIGKPEADDDEILIKDISDDILIKNPSAPLVGGGDGPVAVGHRAGEESVATQIT